MLVTGSWNDPGLYMCSFDNVCVPATVVQSGVLRCYCPRELNIFYVMY